MAIMDRAKEKAGPLPVYGWVLVLGGGLVAILYWQKKKAAKSAGATDNIDPSTGQPFGIDPATGDPYTAADAYGAADIQAEYALANQLGLVQSVDANLATNVGKNTQAQAADTSAVNRNSAATNRNTNAVNQGTKEETKEVTAKKPVHKRKPPVKHKPKPPVRRRPGDLIGFGQRVPSAPK
jgi:hypothetical protein